MFRLLLIFKLIIMDEEILEKKIKELASKSAIPEASQEDIKRLIRSYYVTGVMEGIRHTLETTQMSI